MNRKTKPAPGATRKRPPRREPTDDLQAGIRVGEVARLLGGGISTVWRRSATDPTFPKPRRLGRRHTIWIRGEVLAWRDQGVNK